MRAAGFSDAELDVADMFEGYAVVDMLVEDLRLQSGNALCGFFSCSANALFPGSSLGFRSNNALLALELSVVLDESVKPEEAIECAYEDVDDAET